VASFAFASGFPTVTVTLADHGLVAGSTFPVLVPLLAGSVTIFGNYVVSSVTSTSVFVINASTAASTTPTLTASGNGTTATLTYPTTYTIPVGSTIVVAGVTPGGYNGTFTVTASSAGSVSYTNATTGAQTVAGTILVSVAKENGGNARFIYYNGIGVAQDYNEAVKLFTKAAEQGNATAQYALGSVYYNGHGVTKDYKEAVKWLRKSVAQGNAMAEFRLGSCYYYGHGVTKDEKEALKWWTKAADQGNAEAQYNLSQLKKLKSK
jgi:hypothetical protein